MTEKLFYKDVYLKEFDAVVTGVSEKNGKFLAAFDQTAFYPEGGGQDADYGFLLQEDGRKIDVVDVHEQEETIWHTVSEPLETGMKIHGVIDWDRRFDHMQQHSGEHIVSGMICKTFQCDNVGFHMGDDVVTIDYNVRISYEQAMEIEAAANKYIWENHEFVELWPTAEELKEIDYRSKKELSGAVRITSFPGADICACCGTHVSRSGEVGLVKITSAHNFHEGTRLELFCGKRALDFLSMNYRANKDVAVLLSTKEDKTPQMVEKQLADYIQLKAENTAIEDRLFRMWADSMQGKENILIISDWMNADQGRRLADMISDCCGGITAALTPAGEEENSFRYALISKGNDISGFVKEMNGTLNGRGGGRNGFAQGTLKASLEEIRNFFDSFTIVQ